MSSAIATVMAAMAVEWTVLGRAGWGKYMMVNTLVKSKAWKSTPLGLGQVPMVTHAPTSKT